MSTPTLQRRHGPECEAQYPKGSFSFESDERRHGAKRCTCRIYACGTLSGIFNRLATKQREWSRAQEVFAPYLAAGRWDITPPDTPPSAPPPPPDRDVPRDVDRDAAGGTPIASAIEAYLKEHEAIKSAPNTLKKYREVLGQFQRYADEMGLRYLEEWKPKYTRTLRAAWGNSPLTTQKKLGCLKAFFAMYVEDEVLEKNPAKIRTVKNRAFRKGDADDSKQKNPFIDEELERMLAGCGRVGRTDLRRWPKKREGRQVVPITEYRDYKRKWTGEDLADFIEISVYTGLRISDVATFHISRLQPNGEVRVRATKNGNWVCVWIPEWLRKIIEQRAARVGDLIFGTHTTTDINVITDVWRRKLNKLWEQTGPWAQKPTPHRFRHTFVRLLLKRHVPLSVIAELTGDTEQMIRKHYSGWMPDRQETNSRILAEAFAGVPRFHR